LLLPILIKFIPKLPSAFNENLDIVKKNRPKAIFFIDLIGKLHPILLFELILTFKSVVNLNLIRKPIREYLNLVRSSMLR
jgi:hypothetical protein